VSFKSKRLVRKDPVNGKGRSWYIVRFHQHVLVFTEVCISKVILKECKLIYANNPLLLIQKLCTGQEFGFATGPRGGRPSNVGLTPGRGKGAQNGSRFSQTSFCGQQGRFPQKKITFLNTYFALFITA